MLLTAKTQQVEFTSVLLAFSRLLLAVKPSGGEFFAAPILKKQIKMKRHKTTQKMSKGTIATLLFLFATLYLSFKFNPVDYFIEASPAAYYQARIGYEHGNSADRDQIRKIITDGRLSMHDYSKVVLPIFGKTAFGLQASFPEQEQSKSLDALKREFFAAVTSSKR